MTNLKAWCGLKTIGLSDQWRTYPRPDWLLDDRHMWIWLPSLD